MSGIMSRILPRETTFFDLFDKQAENIHSAAEALVVMFTDFTNPQEKAERVKDLEHIGDDMVHNIMTRLNQTFITPFDREDIHALASKLDDVLDLIDAAASRLLIYNVDRIRPGVPDLARVIEQATREMVGAVKQLEKHDNIFARCIEINRLENEGDRISRALIGQLFSEEKDPVQIIKWKEIIEVMETATDKCEDVANVLESVTLKNS